MSGRALLYVQRARTQLAVDQQLNPLEQIVRGQRRNTCGRKIADAEFERFARGFPIRDVSFALSFAFALPQPRQLRIELPDGAAGSNPARVIGDADTIRARIRAAIRRVMIEIPGWRDWCFAIKTFCAAIAALYLAFWFDLSRPYWALTTVYITSQVLSGATQSKALFRVLGTLLGATVSIILIPNLVNAPTLLCLAIALWVALCLYFSLLDRTPRSYVLMLAGYTLGIIGFPSVDAPGTIFDTAVSRVEEITLGILCASLVSIAVFPQSALPLISTRLDNWILNARAWVIDIFQRNSWAIDTQTERLKLASEAIALDSLATSLRYEMAGIKGADQAMAVLRQHMLMFLPIASSISDRIQVLESIGALSERIRALLSDAAWWLRSDLTDRQLANDLRQRCEKLEPKLDASSTWAALLEASLLRRLCARRGR